MRDISRDSAACIDFLKFSLQDNAAAPPSLADLDWDLLYDFGSKQAVLGVFFHGLKKLGASKYRPGKLQVLKWYSACSSIEQANRQTYKDASALTDLLYRKYGVRSCVLKGQTNALMYPDPYMRTSGDIDLWTDAETLDVISIARQLDAKGEIGYHHIEVDCLTTPVEIHFFPSFMGNLWHEYKLRKFFNQCKEAQLKMVTPLPDGLGRICTLTDDFNRIFQMSHLMHHFFFEGIGLRQMVDYYYLLRRGISEDERRQTVRVLRKVNMYKFASAVMYVMREVLGLPDEYLLMEPNRRIGKMLVSEMLQGGNFGFHDNRYSFADKSVYSQYFIEIYRNLHFALDFPSETLWGRPVSRWWHMIYKAWLRRQVKKRSEFPVR